MAGRRNNSDNIIVADTKEPEENKEDILSKSTSTVEIEKNLENTIEDIANKSNENRILVTVYPILYLSRQYKVGEELPTNNHDMTKAWISSGAAAWITPDKVKKIARISTAEPGLSGTAMPADENCLVGKISDNINQRGI